jgi:uncharacterized membrane protein
LRTQTLESVVALPLIAVFGAVWGAAGAAGAVLVSIVVFAAVWIVLVLRIEPVDEPSPSAFDEELVAEEAEAGALSP